LDLLVQHLVLEMLVFISVVIFNLVLKHKMDKSCFKQTAANM